MSVSRLLSIMREQGEKNNPPYISLGVITSVEPFLVQIGNLTLDKDDLYAPSDLLENSISADVKLTGALSGSTGVASCNDSNQTNHSHTLGSTSFKGDGEFVVKSQFEVGDILALLPLQNKQQYIIINKVVKMK